MATRLLLADISALYREQCGIDVHFRSVGGVDAARLVREGNPFDLVVLASDAIDALIASGHVVGGSKTNVVRSNVAVAVRAGTAHPAIHNERALRESIRAANRIGYSTGPSGTALMSLFAAWGITDSMGNRFVLAPPGVPVGQLVADGVVDLGFQQFSELMNLPGIDVLGTMPDDCAIVTTFSAGVCTNTTHLLETRELLDFLCSQATDELKQCHGMGPA
ncbi:molybdenum ABC transporter substrate-binding protein [Paraburkholderia ginsengiterrae]|uniref:Molybdenum ABC transporter substrate-binding protein n=2 Tax=Paraburkholderia ginsengiterrae TaxID=1462993 RepID=A0A1A9MWY5_9BURK|nr:molybdenum ABC transporter substrate-binding protein [Paraburkholderia ginsengiterrae]OAJ52633.1 molybdenum ABC transporter substrate-binding protein [Paraburkholderia ginsengiterrae]